MQLGIGIAIFLLPWVATRSSLAHGVRGLRAAASPSRSCSGCAGRARPRRAGTAHAHARRSSAIRRSWRLGLVNGATFSLIVVLGTWIAVYFVEEFDLALTTGGHVRRPDLACSGMVGRPLGGLLLARGAMGARALIRWTLTGSVLALLLLAMPGRPVARRRRAPSCSSA